MMILGQPEVRAGLAPWATQIGHLVGLIKREREGEVGGVGREWERIFEEIGEGNRSKIH